MSDTIDINISPVVENVTLTIEPNLTTINVNTINGGGGIESVVAGANISVDNTDPDNPIVSATGLVPYTGATSDVNLGEFGVLTGNLEFDNTPTNIPTAAGSVYYNDTDGTLDLILKGGNVKLQVGQEQVIRVVNKTATNINLLESNYQAVRVTGAQGQRLKVDLAQATTDNLSAETIGLVTETINNNQEGFITTSGLVRNINTTGSLQGETWADGDILYLSPTTAGRITKVKPVAPNHLVIIGYVVSAHATQGSIFVKVDNGYELDELHNVKIDTPLNNQGLIYNSTLQVWENKKIDLQRVLTEGDRAIKVISDFAPYTFELLDKSKFLIDNDGEDKTVPPNVFPDGAVLKIFAEVSTINILQGVGVNIYAGGTPSDQTLEIGELAILTLGGTNSWRFNKIGYKEIPDTITIDATPTDGSSNAVSSNGVFDALALKADNSIINRFKKGIQFFTDFDNLASNITGFQFNGSNGGTAVLSTNTIPNRAINQIGFCQYQTATSSGSFAFHQTQITNFHFAFGGGVWHYETFVCIETLSDATDRFNFRAGFGTSSFGNSEVDAVMFLYDNGGTQNGTSAIGNWQVVTSSNSVRTVSNTGVVIVAGTWVKLRIEINADATSVIFKIDGVTVATHTTNIPTFASVRFVSVKQGIAKSAGTTNRSVFCDYIGYENILTTPR